MSVQSGSWGNYLLKELSETPIPQSIPWWPHTLGWQIVAVCVLIWSLNKMYQRYLRYKRNQYRRDALAWFRQLPHESAEAVRYYRSIPTVLRSAALQAYERRAVSRLSGQNWVDWLNQQCPSPCLSSQSAELLHQLAFARLADYQPDQIQQLCREITIWLTQHQEAS